MLISQYDGWPTQARFWLEWGMFRSSQFCHPDRWRSSRSDDRRSGGILCFWGVEIESEWMARKRERAAGILCPAIELPTRSPTDSAANPNDEGFAGEGARRHVVPRHPSSQAC